MINLFALHGFLGLPSDWNFSKRGNPIHLHAIDIYSVSMPQNGLWYWAERFNAIASRENSPRILLGYSLGGRLALHAILENPSLWEAAIIISAYPGGMNVEDKKLRCLSDEGWARRFVNEPWEDLIRDWNAQGSLQSSCCMVREEKDYHRNLLAATLEHWSPGKQDNLLPSLSKLKIPVFWMAGRRDDKFAALAESVTLSHPRSKIWIAPDAGHRLPWDISEKFQIEVDRFLNQYMQEE